MRSLLALFVMLSALAGARAADAAITNIWPQWRDAASFDRISEYFSREENTGGHTILRTHPDTRAGFYFLVRLAASATANAAKFEVNVIAPGQPEPQTFAFPLPRPAKENVFELGLTGADWPAGEKARPVAWRIALLGADGSILAEQKSFLWENPAK